jgi:hypothetical protein
MGHVQNKTNDWHVVNRKVIDDLVNPLGDVFDLSSNLGLGSKASFDAELKVTDWFR